MKIIRSTKCSLCFATPAKLAKLSLVLAEYGRVVNHFIDRFWVEPVEKAKLLKDIVNEPETGLSARSRKVAAREALDMCSSVKSKGGTTKPTHAGKRPRIYSLDFLPDLTVPVANLWSWSEMNRFEGTVSL
jgi:hypothetical protein